MRICRTMARFGRNKHPIDLNGIWNHLRRKRRAAVLRTAVPGLFPRKWKMTRKTSQRRTNRNYCRNPNTRRVAWDDLRAMTPIEPHTDFSKPPIGYVLDDDGNYPESIREVF